ncbi:MAG: hypothetical protein WBE34_12705 [Candidatus Nitrosopolaris sp.]
MTKGQNFIIDNLELGMKGTVYYLIILAAAGLISLYYYSTQINKPKYALELDPTKDTTDMAGIQYRVRVNNVGLNQLTGITVVLEKNDTQHLSFLDPGQTYTFFSPKPDTNITTVKISTNEGIVVQGDYRSPTKVLGLPGSGR